MTQHPVTAVRYRPPESNHRLLEPRLRNPSEVMALWLAAQTIKRLYTATIEPDHNRSKV
jgi:hypothetical protein